MHVCVVCAWVHGSPRTLMDAWDGGCAHVRVPVSLPLYDGGAKSSSSYGTCTANFSSLTARNIRLLAPADRSQQSRFWTFSKIHAVRATFKISFRRYQRPFPPVRLHFWIRENFRRWPHSSRTSLRILPTWIFKFSLRHQQAADFNVCQTALWLHYASSKIRHKSHTYKA